MNDAEVKKQIKQMIAFIKQEAQEKAEEIQLKAEEEFNIEKLRMVEAERSKIRKAYERKEKQSEVQKRIQYSTELNASRLRLLKAREESMQVIFDESRAKLAGVCGNKATYKPLLQKIISESLCMLEETDVTMYCRQQDVQLVKEVLPAALNQARTKLNKEVNVQLNSKDYLPGPPTDSSGMGCYGGVVVEGKVGLIRLDNTLDERLRLAFEGMQPDLRTALVGSEQSRRFVC